MDSQIWVVGTLLSSIIIIIFTIVKLKIHPFLALLLASFYVGLLMGMNPIEMVNSIESGIGGTLGFSRSDRAGHHFRQNDGGIGCGRAHRYHLTNVAAGYHLMSRWC